MTSSRESALAWTVPGFDDDGPWIADAAVPGSASLAWVPAELGIARPAPLPSAMDEAYRRGFADGVRDGHARAGDDMRPAIDMLTSLVSHLADCADAFARDRERNLEGLAIAIARHLVHREVTADPGILRDLITRGLELLPHDAEVTVRLNPEDLEALGGAIEQISTPGRAVRLHWLTDPEIERGSFIAESPQRMVDGRSDVALRVLYEKLGDA